MTKKYSIGDNKQQARTLLEQVASADPGNLEERLAAVYHPEARWRGSHPLNELSGLAAIQEKVWAPLLHSFPDLERRDFLVMGGDYQGRSYVGMVGHLAGTFTHDWLDIPASGGLAYLRYGEVHQFEDGRIVETTALIDLLNLLHQAGLWPLPPSRGSQAMWPAPILGADAAPLEPDPDRSAASMELCLAMQQTLDNDLVERDQLLNMSQKKYWHPKMMWYGPAGIGSCRGLPGFVDHHQRPFRIAFPRRNYGGEHYLRIGDGCFAATAGWPSVTARHDGPWLGQAPCGREIKMRVMDFYLCDEGLVRENWVPIDVIDMLLQMDLDVMDWVRQQRR